MPPNRLTEAAMTAASAATNRLAARSRLTFLPLRTLR